MLSPYDIIFAHVVMPDSIIERKKVLQAMKAVVTPKHDAYATIVSQLAALDKVEALQKELPLKFTLENWRSKQGDGK